MESSFPDMKKLILITVTILLFSLLYVSINSNNEQLNMISNKIDTVVESKNKNWMELHKDSIGDLKLSDLCIPGTHDSGVYRKVNMGISLDGEDTKLRFVSFVNLILFGAIGNVVNKWTITQYSSIYNQLSMGIRYIDIRIAYSKDTDDYYIQHTFASVPFREVLNDIKRFVADHKKEIIFMNLGLNMNSGSRYIEIFNLVKDNLGDSLIQNTIAMDTKIKDVKKSIYFMSSHHDDKTFDFVHDGGIQSYGWLDSNNIEDKIKFMKKQLDKYSVADNSYINKTLFLSEFTITPNVWNVFLQPFSNLSNISSNAHQRLTDFVFSLKEKERKNLGIVALDFFNSSDVVDICVDICKERGKLQPILTA
jgi:hypothetical protein